MPRDVVLEQLDEPLVSLPLFHQRGNRLTHHVGHRPAFDLGHGLQTFGEPGLQPQHHVLGLHQAASLISRYHDTIGLALDPGRRGADILTHCYARPSSEGDVIALSRTDSEPDPPAKPVPYAYLGPEGTFTEAALLAFDPGPRATPCPA